MAKLVLDEPPDELIAVQALKFRRDWRGFLDLIMPDQKRRVSLNEYKKLREQGKDITNQAELKFNKEMSESNNPLLSKDTIEIYRELLLLLENGLVDYQTGEQTFKTTEKGIHFLNIHNNFKQITSI